MTLLNSIWVASISGASVLVSLLIVFVCLYEVPPRLSAAPWSTLCGRSRRSRFQHVLQTAGTWRSGQREQAVNDRNRYVLLKVKTDSTERCHQETVNQRPQNVVTQELKG